MKKRLVSIVTPVYNESGNLMPMPNKLNTVFSDTYRYKRNK